jgi:hypothetical protein
MRLVQLSMPAAIGRSRISTRGPPSSSSSDRIGRVLPRRRPADRGDPGRPSTPPNAWSTASRPGRRPLLAGVGPNGVAPDEQVDVIQPSNPRWGSSRSADDLPGPAVVADRDGRAALDGRDTSSSSSDHEGLTGVGFGMTRDAPVAAILARNIAPFLLGADPPRGGDLGAMPTTPT